MSHRSLQIWQEARDLSIAIHRMSLDLPRFELYEQGSQIRRSSKSVRANIVEGYGRRRYKADYIRFLSYALASNLETEDHLECLWETESLLDEETFRKILNQCQTLGKKVNKFIQSVEQQHKF